MQNLERIIRNMNKLNQSFCDSDKNSFWHRTGNQQQKLIFEKTIFTSLFSKLKIFGVPLLPGFGSVFPPLCCSQRP